MSCCAPIFLAVFFGRETCASHGASSTDMAEPLCAFVRFGIGFEAVKPMPTRTVMLPQAFPSDYMHPWSVACEGVV